MATKRIDQITKQLRGHKESKLKSEHGFVVQAAFDHSPLTDAKWVKAVDGAAQFLNEKGELIALGIGGLLIRPIEPSADAPIDIG